MIKKVKIKELTGPNRHITIEENIFSDYSKNHLSLSIQPDDLFYKVNYKDRIDLEAKHLMKSYVLEDYTNSLLVLNICRNPITTTDRFTRKKGRAFVYFQIFFKTGGRKNPFIPLFFTIEDSTEEILIEKRLHDILSDKNINDSERKNSIKDLILSSVKY